jgi:hypothetical protein
VDKRQAPVAGLAMDERHRTSTEQNKITLFLSVIDSCESFCAVGVVHLTRIFLISDDISVRLFEQSADGELLWETFADVNNLEVHHQVICFGFSLYVLNFHLAFLELKPLWRQCVLYQKPAVVRVDFILH